MRYHSFAIGVGLALFVLLTFFLYPKSALAERQVILKIDENYYQLFVGYTFLRVRLPVELGTGVALTVRNADPEDPINKPTRGTVNGLEKTLKAEMIFGEHRMEVSLQSVPVPDMPLAANQRQYFFPFFPTEVGEYAFRYFGTINEVPLDITFNCNPKGLVEVDESSTIQPVKISERVTQIHAFGSFLCVTKVTEGFPNPVKTRGDLQKDLARLETKINYLGGSVVAVLVLLAFAWVQRRRRTAGPPTSP